MERQGVVEVKYEYVVQGYKRVIIESGEYVIERSYEQQKYVTE